MSRFVRVILACGTAYVAILAAGYFLGAFGIKRHQIESGFFILVPLLVVSVVARSKSSHREPMAGMAPIDAAIAAVLAIAACARGLDVGLLSDDFVLRSWVLEGRFRWEGAPFERPVPLAIWRVVFLAGGGAGVLHLLNLALHALNTVLAGRLAARLGLGRAGVAVAAVTFLLWPTQVEPVVWAAGVFDVLATTWMLLALGVLVRSPRVLPGPLDIILVSALAVLAFFTKESAVALPLLAVVVLLPAYPRNRSSRQLVVVGALVLSTAAYFCWRLATGLAVTGTAGVTRYMAKEQLSRTFGTLAVPFSSDTIQSAPLLILLIVTGVVLMATASVAASQRRSAGHVVAIQGLLWCAIAAAPTIGFLFIGNYLEGSRYLYLAALGWGLVLGGTLDALWERQRFRWAALTVLTITFAAAAVEQQRRLSDWREAARQRDAILAQAARLAAERRCGTVSAGDLPPTFKGAQLFTNGFGEAIESALVRDPGLSSSCQWTWTGQGFREN